MANSDCKIISFDSPLKKACNLMTRTLKLEQKAISTQVSGKDLLAVLPTSFWKSPIFHILVLMKEIMTGNP